MSRNSSDGLALARRPESVPAGMEGQARALAEMTTEQLRGELARSLELTAAHLVRLALIVRTLEDRGEDLAGLRIHMLPYLRQIAYGQVLPEIVVRFAESPLLIRSISTLPIPDQRSIAEGRPVPMAIRKDDGSVDHRLVDPAYLRREQVAQVFARDRIRPIEEQIVLLEARGKPREPKPATKGGAVRPDRERGGIVVGRTFVPLSDVVSALAELREAADVDVDAGEEGTRKVVPVYLTERQHDRLAQLALDGRTKMAPLVRRALVAYGLI